jgi:hypothetical protein
VLFQQAENLYKNLELAYTFLGRPADAERMRRIYTGISGN